METVFGACLAQTLVFLHERGLMACDRGKCGHREQAWTCSHSLFTAEGAQAACQTSVMTPMAASAHEGGPVIPHQVTSLSFCPSWC